MSCKTDYQACLKNCRPATGYDAFLCKASCTLDYFECLLPNINIGVLGLLDFILALEALRDDIDQQLLIARSSADVELSKLTVVKAGGLEEPFVPNVKLRRRLELVGIRKSECNDVIRFVSGEFRDGQSTQDIRAMATNRLAEKDPNLAALFLGERNPVTPPVSETLK